MGDEDPYFKVNDIVVYQGPTSMKVVPDLPKGALGTVTEVVQSFATRYKVKWDWGFPKSTIFRSVNELGGVNMDPEEIDLP